MKFQTLLYVLFSQLVLAGTVRLERRKGFVQTHQEHGHLPGGRNNPGPLALIPQMMAMLGGQSPSSVLRSYNHRADDLAGRRGSQRSGNGRLEAFGFGNVPVIGKMI